MPGRERHELLDCSFDPVTMSEAVDVALSWCLEPRVPHTLITANAAILCMMRRDPELAAACRAGDLIVADGMAVVWTAKAAGLPFPERVAGVDMMARLLEKASEKGLRVFFLGAKAAVIDELVKRCGSLYPGAIVAGARDGYFKPEQHAEIVEQIRASGAHMLFVGMPSPFKETWCERHRAALDVPLIMGVGGAFDVLAGFVKRAPRFLQVVGLEWSWRLLMEPRKMWKRYLVTNSEYMWRAAGEVLGRRFGSRATS